MQDVKYKRELGNGRWDRKLKENMVALSKADNYDEASMSGLPLVRYGEVLRVSSNLAGLPTKVIVCVVTIVSL